MIKKLATKRREMTVIEVYDLMKANEAEYNHNLKKMGDCESDILVLQSKMIKLRLKNKKLKNDYQKLVAMKDSRMR